MSVQGLGPQYNAYQARPAAQQFGAARKPQAGAPKFGMDPITCCLLPCAAPLLIPAGIGGFFLFKAIKKAISSITGGIGNGVNSIRNKGRTGGE